MLERPTHVQRDARKRVFKDRECISQRGDEVREQYRSKATVKERREKVKEKRKVEKVDLHKRS